MIPFAIEATGRLGPSALAFVRQFNYNPSAINEFVDDLGIVLAHYQGLCTSNLRSSINVVPQGRAILPFTGVGGMDQFRFTPA